MFQTLNISALFKQNWLIYWIQTHPSGAVGSSEIVVRDVLCLEGHIELAWACCLTGVEFIHIFLRYEKGRDWERSSLTAQKNIMPIIQIGTIQLVAATLKLGSENCWWGPINKLSYGRNVACFVLAWMYTLGSMVEKCRVRPAGKTTGDVRQDQFSGSGPLTCPLKHHWQLATW